VSPVHLLNVFGTIGLIAIIFAETGLLIGIVLPGDSLLVTAGLLAATHRRGDVHLNLTVVIVGCAIAAVAGAQTGYWIGRRVGRPLFNRPNSRFFKREYVERAEDYFNRFGGPKAVVLARFIPGVRTLMNPLAGVVDMDHTAFTAWNVIGGLAWAVGVTLLGYTLGSSVKNIDKYLLPIIAVVVVLSLIPIALEVRKARRQSRLPSGPAHPG
jgi:membrane-associated protein